MPARKKSKSKSSKKKGTRSAIVPVLNSKGKAVALAQIGQRGSGGLQLNTPFGGLGIGW